jgi:hypothetical protein
MRMGCLWRMPLLYFLSNRDPRVARSSTVSNTVQLLWFVEEREQGEGTELFIGVYQTESDARTAIERLRNKPGFVDFPQGFMSETYELNKDHWTEGFVRL